MLFRSGVEEGRVADDADHRVEAAFGGALGHAYRGAHADAGLDGGVGRQGAEAVAADLDNSETLAMLLGMVFPGLDPQELVEELRARITEELDYVNEADNVRLFADYYRGHPHIWIPDVVTTHSSGTVLTTEFVDEIVVMYAGTIVERASTEALFAEPMHPYTRGLLRSVPSYGDNPRKKRLQIGRAHV